ncbi:trypsin-like serine protease [Streptomyces cyaneofuscatus]|uniref:trypsin-like serine protease n=1 Tax=Streptomyces cyaneofuscatus TaxID=66883 RepID=UPI0037AE9B6F|nr:trypsin-like serine protease [Streptomyces cyaneofuscatus]
MPFARPRPKWLAACTTVGITATLLSAGTTGTAGAVVGSPAPTGQYVSVVKLNIGDEANSRACSGTLVDPSWVLTAASCFAATPGAAVPAGRPALTTTATLSDGKAVAVTDVVPHSGRDLALARLAAPAAVASATRAAAAPAAGADLTAVGFGRTRTEWVPAKLHTGTFTVNTSDATTLAITGKGTDAICKGDTGGPLLNDAGHIVGVNSRSWQGGCLGTDRAETRTGAIAARADGLDNWIAGAKARSVILASGATLQSGEQLLSESGRLVMQADGNLVVYHVTGGEGRGGALWASGTGGNAGAFAKMQPDGNLVVYKKGSTGDSPSGALWQSSTFGNPGARLEVQGDANVVVYTKDGGRGIGGHLWHTDTYPRGDRLASGAKLMPGSWLTNGKNVLLMDIMGNAVVRELATHREVWGKYSWDWYSYLFMQPDGNLVLYKKNTTAGALWATETYGGSGSYATLDTNNSLTVRWQSGGPRWNSNSLRGAQSNRCLDFNGTDTMIYDCWGGPNQQWEHTPAKEMRLDGDRCLTAETGAPQSSRLKALPCDGRGEQQWNYDGTTLSSVIKPEQCVNVFSQAVANGSPVGLWACGTGTNAKWKRP